MNVKPESIARQRVLSLSRGMILSAALVAGCAIDTAPMGELAEARSAVDEALRAGAGELAGKEIRLARDKIALGERWIAAGDHRPARWLVEQAQVDAELAAMKAASIRARKNAAALTEELRAFNTALARRAN